MNLKIIIGLVLALCAVYYGSQWMNLRDRMSQEMREDPYVYGLIDHMTDFSMSKSKEMPTCIEDECKYIKRYLFKATGVKGTIYISGDYDKRSKKLTRRSFCDENGKTLKTDPDFLGSGCQ